MVQRFFRAMVVPWILAEWVFQCDSDDEMKAEFFPELWSRRAHMISLFGYRTGRRQNSWRKFDQRLLTFDRASLLFGPGIVDVNTPYRLMRSALLKLDSPTNPCRYLCPECHHCRRIRQGASARIYNLPIPHENRKTGIVSIVRWRLVRAAFRSFLQTLRCRPTMTPDGRSVKIGIDAGR